MEWIRPQTPFRAKEPVAFRFRLLDPQGRAPSDMQLYMGMLGHAAFVKTDGTVFAHIHPTGSVSMAAFMLAQNQLASNAHAAGMQMPGMEMSAMAMPRMAAVPEGPHGLPDEVAFPYGFPTPGRYRIFVQLKHADIVETGVFDTDVQ